LRLLVSRRQEKVLRRFLNQPYKAWLPGCVLTSEMSYTGSAPDSGHGTGTPAATKSRFTAAILLKEILN
jgi:hypothetical protein